MAETDHFPRTIGLPTAISVVVSGVIGSGIFMRPAEMAGLLGSPVLILLVWVIGGVFTLFSIMVLAEIGAMIPATGGQYVFMREMYGKFWAYLFGWASFAVINTAGTAGITFIFAQYAGYFFHLPVFSTAIEHSLAIHIPLIGTLFPLENFGAKLLTLFVLCLFTAISYRSTKMGGIVQVFFTTTKVLAIVLLICGLFLSPAGSTANFTTTAAVQPVGFALMVAMVAAFNGALQSYDGGYMIVYMAGEVRNPGKILPRSLLGGMLICILVYVAINAAMVYILPVQSMALSQVVAADAAKAAFGTIGGGIIAFLICLSVLGTTNCNVLSSPRITYAMARERSFFPWAGKVHPRFKTPSAALLLHLAWMALLVFSGSFFILADMYIFIVFVFNILIVYGLFILRRKMKDAPRPFKMWGYPYMPALVLLVNAVYLVVIVYNDIHNYLTGKTHVVNSVFGLALVAIGIPLYWYFKKRPRSPETAIIVLEAEKKAFVPENSLDE